MATRPSSGHTNIEFGLHFESVQNVYFNFFSLLPNCCFVNRHRNTHALTDICTHTHIVQLSPCWPDILFENILRRLIFVICVTESFYRSNSVETVFFVEISRFAKSFNCMQIYLRVCGCMSILSKGNKYCLLKTFLLFKLLWAMVFV